MPEVGSPGAQQEAEGQAAMLTLLTHQQPSVVPSPPTSGEGKDREQLLLFSKTFFRPVPPAQCCSPATPAVVSQPQRAQSRADAGGDTVPIPRRLPPNHQSLVCTSTQRDGPGIFTPRATAPVPLCSPPAPSGISEMLRHEHTSSNNPPRRDAYVREGVTPAHGLK